MTRSPIAKPEIYEALEERGVNSANLTELVSGIIVDCTISPDREYLYYPTGGAAPKAVPIRLADRRVGRNTDLKDLRRVLGPVLSETQISCAPDGSPVFTRNSAHRKSMRSPSGGRELLSRYLNSPRAAHLV